MPIDVDQEEPVHSSPVPEAELAFVHSPASPDFSERAFSEPPERPQPEGRLRTRPRILRPPSDLPPGTYPTVRLDRQGLWILVSPNPGLPATSGVRDAEQLPNRRGSRRHNRAHRPLRAKPGAVGRSSVGFCQNTCLNRPCCRTRRFFYKGRAHS